MTRYSGLDYHHQISHHERPEQLRTLRPVELHNHRVHLTQTLAPTLINHFFRSVKGFRPIHRLSQKQLLGPLLHSMIA